MNGNSINPCFETGLAVEVLHPAKNFQEDLLCGIGGICGIRENAVHHAVHGVMKLTDEPRVGIFRARLELQNNGGLLAADSYRAREFSQTGGSRHACHGDPLIIGPLAYLLLPEWLDNSHNWEVPDE